MVDKVGLFQRIGQNCSVISHWPKVRGLQASITISYVWVTMAAVLILETLGLALNGSRPQQFTGPLLRIVLLSLVIAAPLGGLFGRITTHNLVRRISHLVQATTRFAAGDYAQRVHVAHADEVGQLEQHFNDMAEQLVTSIAQQQALAEQNARMHERARISRDLHDAIAQNLFSLRTMTTGLQGAIQSGTGIADLQPRVSLLEQITDTMAREIRALLLEMRPPQLEGLQLADALALLAEVYTSRLGIAVSTTIVPVALSATTEQALLRITQEALSNVAHHADATHMTLSLACREQMVCLTITDNGKGMRPDERGKSHGLGLSLMQERARELQGSFSLESTPGQGTRLKICVPQEERDDTHPYCR